MPQKCYHFALVALVFFSLCGLHFTVSAQPMSTLQGTITDGNTPLAMANVRLSGLQRGTISDPEGKFTLKNIPSGTHRLIVSMVGFRTWEKEVKVRAGETQRLDIRLSEDQINLEQVVVTGTRSEVPLLEAPVIVSQISAKTFRATQSLTLSEGLNFTPGLRLENNCQNCGFTQVRMNGLGGAYSQILINSRPIFSALTGVYGLDMLPANMIERVEVVRGGGSALYGGNAIAGTINIITREPVENSVEVGLNYGLTDGSRPDRTLTLNGAVVSDDLSKGLSFYAFNRNRQQWDANDDGFSEITRLKNTTFGMDAFWEPSETSKIKLNLFTINEFRRGGSQFHLPPHQTDITEQLDHRILGGALSYEQQSKDERHRFSVYTSAQTTERQSYYGGGGRVLTAHDTLTQDDLIALNAYGNSNDLTLVTGVQYGFAPNDLLAFVIGSEYQYSDVTDRMPGYEREIRQQVGTLGSYAQVEFTPSHRWSFLMGGRLDYVTINGRYDFEAETLKNQQTLPVFVPRATAMYELTESLKLRASFAQGYRAPQAFDEDLHIETVGGAALFTRLDPDLETERSNSFTSSLNYSTNAGKWQLNLVAEGFHTRLSNPFITSDQRELPSGVAVITKRNGAGATVQGINIEANLAFAEKLVIQSGFTLQEARFDETEVLWEPGENGEGKPTTTRRLLRTPNAYGFLALNFTPTTRWTFSGSGVLTGGMEVPHVVDAETERTLIRATPSFAEINLKASYRLSLGEQAALEVFAGVQNLFSSYQQDFDRGATRDAGYIYGPARPRTLFGGLTFGLP